MMKLGPAVFSMQCIKASKCCKEDDEVLESAGTETIPLEYEAPTCVFLFELMLLDA